MQFTVKLVNFCLNNIVNSNMINISNNHCNINANNNKFFEKILSKIKDISPKVHEKK